MYDIIIASDDDDDKGQHDTEDSDAILDGGDSFVLEDKESPVDNKGSNSSQEINDRDESLADAEARRLQEQEEADFQLALSLSQLPERQTEIAEGVQVSGRQNMNYQNSSQF